MQNAKFESRKGWTILNKASKQKINGGDTGTGGTGGESTPPPVA